MSLYYLDYVRPRIITTAIVTDTVVVVVVVVLVVVVVCVIELVVITVCPLAFRHLSANLLCFCNSQDGNIGDNNKKS